jgi:hypothetical protein
VVVLSSAHELYLRNQQELHRTVSVLYPFWVAAGIAVLLGTLLQRADGRPGARRALVAYYSFGFGFMAWSFLRALPLAGHFPRWVLDLEGGAAVFAALWIGATVFATSRAGPRVLEPVVAVITVALLAHEAVLFSTRLDHGPPPPPRDMVAELTSGGDPGRSNVYHLILDSFPDDLFDPCLPPGGEGALDGFVRFHAVSRTPVTSQAVPSMFAGRWLASIAEEERVREGLTGEGSLLPWLRRAGYQTVGFVPRNLYRDVPSALDSMAFHDENVREADVRAFHVAVFLRLWAIRTLPLGLSKRAARGSLFGWRPNLFEVEDTERVSTFAQPVVALLSMDRLLEMEPQLPARGRYTLVHLLLPHRPYRLRRDCSYGSGSEPSDLGQQTECTLRLVLRFVELLRRLDRLDGSVVVLHGDHGINEVLREGQFVEDESAWVRTTLLVKPAGARGPLRLAEATAHMEDVAPTLLALLGAPPEPSHEGRVLSDVLEALPEGPPGVAPGRR